MISDLTEFQEDALKEVGNIASGNASKALYNLIGEKIDLKIPDVELVSVKKFQEKVGHAERITSIIYSEIFGDIRGCLLIVLLGDVLEKKDLRIKNQEELLKIGGTFSTLYRAAINEFLDIETIQSDPILIYTVRKPIYDFIYIKKGEVLMIKTNFSIPSIGVNGNFSLLLSSKSAEVLVKKIEKKLLL